jgi:hypothetical protein
MQKQTGYPRKSDSNISETQYKSNNRAGRANIGLYE